MKQIKFVATALVAVMMLLTSCLGDSSNSGELYGVPGKIRYSSGKLLIDTSTGTLYTTQLSTSEYYDGDWVYVSFSYNMDTEENANAEANGYTHVTLLQSPSKISEGQVYGSADTTQVYTGEITLINPAYNAGHYQYFAYMDGDLMFTSEYSGLTDQRTSFQMYYDYNQESYSYNGKNTYTFYVRAIETAEGKTPTITYYAPNYYNVSSVISSVNQREKAAGNSSFCLDFRYVKEIDEETREITWSSIAAPVEFAVME